MSEEPPPTPFMDRGSEASNEEEETAFEQGFDPRTTEVTTVASNDDTSNEEETPLDEGATGTETFYEKFFEDEMDAAQALADPLMRENAVRRVELIEFATELVNETEYEIARDTENINPRRKSMWLLIPSSCYSSRHSSVRTIK